MGVVVNDRALSDGWESGEPAIVAVAGASGRFAREEFFRGWIRNSHTRGARGHAVARLLAWCDEKRIALPQVTPRDVGAYFDQHPGSIPTKKHQLAAIRGLFEAVVLWRLSS